MFEALLAAVGRSGSGRSVASGGDGRSCSGMGSTGFRAEIEAGDRWEDFGRQVGFTAARVASRLMAGMAMESTAGGAPAMRAGRVAARREASPSSREEALAHTISVRPTSAQRVDSIYRPAENAGLSHAAPLWLAPGPRRVERQGGIDLHPWVDRVSRSLGLLSDLPLTRRGLVWLLGPTLGKIVLSAVGVAGLVLAVHEADLLTVAASAVPLVLPLAELALAPLMGPIVAEIVLSGVMLLATWLIWRWQRQRRRATAIAPASA